MKQKVKDPFWTDETGMQIPVARIFPIEKQKEKTAGQLLSRAESVSKQLISLKEEFRQACEKIYIDSLAELGGKEGKGNFTFYNFDRSIKIETSIKDRIVFDDITIDVARQKLMQFLDESVQSEVEFVKDIINDAFSTSSGALDTKKVMGLLKYRTRVKNGLFQEALELIEKAIRRPDMKTYYRIWAKDSDGEYKAVELNFSNV